MNHVFPIIDEPYHKSLRTTASYLSVVALCALVLGFVWMDWLPLPKIATTFNLAFFAAASLLCNVTFKRGASSLAYRLSNFIESESLLVGFAVELALTRPDNPILWAFYLIQALMLGLTCGAYWSGLVGIALPPAVLGVWSYFSTAPDSHHLMVIVTSAILTVSLYWGFGTTRMQQVQLLEKSLRTDNELKLAQLALESERKVHALESEWIDALEKTSAALFIFDATGLSLAVRGAAEFNRFAVAEEHIHPDLLPLLDRADLSPAPVSVFGHRLDSHRDEHVDITVMRMPGEDVQKRFAMIVNNATERIGLEAKNMELNERLLVADKMASLGVLAAGVAHEINNPLTYIAGNIEYILGLTEIPSKLKNPLQDVQMGFRQIERIVGDLKTFSHTTRHRTYEAVDLRNIVERTSRMLAPEIRQAARFEVVLPDQPVSVLCQPDRIQQVILNLVINARQALPERHRSENLIRVHLEANESSAFLNIDDNGEGISGEVLRKVFDPFFTTKAPGIGTGLGLSVSYEIAREHEGQIFVKSVPGQGSTFTLTLPLKLESSSKIPILVIDDEDRTLTLFSRVLQGFEVTTASSVATAIPLLDRAYRAVLCDVRLSDGNGFDVYRRAPDMLKPKFIFLTALPLNAAELQQRPAKTRILHKPIQIQELEAELLAKANEHADFDEV